MKQLLFIVICLPLFVDAQPAAVDTHAWQPASLTLPTRWSKSVSPSNALPEYPRPQLVRGEWQNLNGLWDYSITDSASAEPKSYAGQILVPYPLESALSGVKGALRPEQRLWYRRDLAIGSLRKERRYLLHFGAVDYQATVYVNGKAMGQHTGGYQEFTIDISGALHKGTNRLTVAVLDPTDKGNNPHGKQTLDPKGIWYTPSSGIWQTVWLESVPTVYIEGLELTPDVDNGVLKVKANVNAAGKGYTVEAVAFSGSAMTGSVKGAPGDVLSLSVGHDHLWSPENPFLYGLSVRLLYNNKVVDTAGSYFGMRKITIAKDTAGQERIFLNDRPYFNLGVLDQGFWPDGLYTAPTDSALLFDVDAIRKMGFNTIRKHIKIEPARWYYDCDRLGLLVWQDMPFPANLSDEAKAEFERESAANLEQLHNHPSIVCWVLFNEGWNSYDQQRLTEWMKKADPSRIVDGHTGENYDRKSPREVSEKWIGSDITDIHDYPGPGLGPSLPGKARVLGEWGGVRVVTPGHEWDPSKGWGYVQSAAADFARKYRFMMRHVKLFEEEGLSGCIYTQPYDVETEENGLMTYDRDVFKIPVEQLRAINALLFGGN